ncbi:MAG: ABC transporter permease [Anaerolineales bacterium]|jgi:molybdate transport system permease protein
MAQPTYRSPLRPAPRRLRRAPGWLLLSVPLLAFLTIPLVILVFTTSPAQLLENLHNPLVVQAVLLSLRTTFISLLIILLGGTPLAYLLARFDFPLRGLVDTLVDLPTVLPPAVAGVALLIAFGRMGTFGPALMLLGIEIPFTSAAVIMAQVFIAAPFYVRSAAIGFAAIDPELEQSAGLDGANAWQVLRHVTLPLARTALLGGAVLAWARALGEFGATIIFAGNFPGRTQTMPLAIYLGFEFDMNIALTLSVLLVGVSFLVMIVVKAVLPQAQVRDRG